MGVGDLTPEEAKQNREYSIKLFFLYDVKIIAERYNLKPKNVQKCKDHVFMNKHSLDRYVSLGEPAELKTFDPDLQMGLAWLRFERGQATDLDKVWLRHEFAESVVEKMYDCGYTEAHDTAQKKYDGNPWGNKCPKNNDKD